MLFQTCTKLTLLAPRKIPTAEIVAAVEESISQLNNDNRHLVRAEVSSILRRTKPPPKNIQFGTRLKEYQKAVFFCKKENSALSEHTFKSLR